jgi:UDP-N-acetylmuramyl pentapeptide synthase
MTHNASPASMLAALTLLADAGRRIAVLGTCANWGQKEEGAGWSDGGGTVAQVIHPVGELGRLIGEHGGGASDVDMDRSRHA